MATVESVLSSSSSSDSDDRDSIVTTRRRGSLSLHHQGQQPGGDCEPTLTVSRGDFVEATPSLSSAETKPSSAPQSPFAKSTKPVVHFHRYLVLALIIRLVLLAFSVWQDETRWPDGQLRFTDVDYDVFSDAAKALIQGDDIYEARPTYRYSPLIAALVAPGFWLSRAPSPTPVKSSSESFFDPPLDTSREGRVQSEFDVESLSKPAVVMDPMLARIWGKLIFIMADIACAWLQFEIIQTEYALRHPGGSVDAMERASQLGAVALICFGWLFNPVTAVVSVRGNAEAVLGLCVLGCLLLVLRHHELFAGLLFGLCIHLKLYPVIYAPAIYLWLTSIRCPHLSNCTFKQRIWNLLPRWVHIRFALGTMASLGTLTGFCYRYFGGWQFLNQAYFYHFTRVDIKHNFAPHFYPLYLLSGLEWRQAGLNKAGSLSEMWQSKQTRALFDRLQQTLGTLTQSSNNATSSSLTELLKSGVRSLLVEDVHLRLMKQVFSLASLLPAMILIPVFAFRFHRSPGLCWFATTYAFVTFNKVCTSQYFLWSLVLLPIALASLKPPSSASIGCVIVESLLIWLGSQAVWLAAAYGLEIYTIHSAWFARHVWLMVWAASLLFLSANVVLLRRLIRWRDPRECCAIGHNVRDQATELASKKQQ